MSRANVSRSLVPHLIVKDLQLFLMPIVATIVVGILCLTLLYWKGLTGLLGIIGFFTAIIVLGSMLPHASIVNERKSKTLPFLMSLPISSIQYTTSKVVGALGMFMISWLTLLAGVLFLILSRADILNGIIPITLILITLPLIGFCLTTGIALVSESEGWTIAATVGCNVAYSLAWVVLASNEELRRGFPSPIAVWSPTVLTILGWEFVAIVGILAVTFYLQSRKTDFV